MAKKTGKRRAQARAARQASAVAARPAASHAESAPVSRVDLAEEYRYVYGDLKRVGILAGSMLGLLIVLALLAQYLF